MKSASLEQFDPLRQFFADLLALGFGHRLLQLIDALGQVHPGQRFAHGSAPSCEKRAPRRRSHAPRGIRVR